MSSENENPKFKNLTEAERKALVASLLMSEEKKRQGSGRGEGPEISGREKILALFGLPVEANSNPLTNVPIATILTIIITSFFSLYFLLVSPAAAELLAFYPGNPLRFGGINLLTCFFVHGSLLHLFGNMYCLYVFGDNVEDAVGITKFWGLLFFATLMGSLLSLTFSHREMIPHVGASGGIFGVMIFYLLRFPKAKFTYLFFFRFVRVPASTILILYIFFQFLGAAEQINGSGGVDHLAHIGGGLAGLLFWFANRQPPEGDATRF